MTHFIKKIFVLSIIVLTVSLSSNSQVININPDPNGDPWFVGGVKALTDEEEELLTKNIHDLTIPKHYNSGKNLPASIDNSTLPYFRPVFIQLGGSCSQASGVAYLFTYEINYLRGLSSDVPENQYPSHFTYNFLNKGSGNYGSTYWDGWKIIEEMGCPTVAEYGGLYSLDNTGWITGYSNYLSAMNNTMYEYYSIDVGSEAGLKTLKGWFLNHLDDNQSAGGVACFSIGASDMTVKHLPIGTPHGTEYIVTDWGETIDHAMTFTGYDDSICYDYNNDGMYTNDIDINNDGVVNMADWEIGGLIIVNSWGNGWANNGKAYMMYRLLLDSNSIGNQKVYVINPRNYYSPELTLKVNISHPSRDKLKIYGGITNDTAAVEPDYTIKYKALKNRGGDLPMTGTSDTIEFALDITSIYKQIHDYENMKVFLQVTERDSDNVANGAILNFAAYTYLNGMNEYACSDSNINIINADLTYLTVTIPGNNFFPPNNLTSSANANSVELNWETPLNHPASWFIDSYKLYRNNELIATITDSLQFSYIDSNLSDGSYSYRISCLYSNNNDFHESMTGNETSRNIALNPIAGAGHCLYFNGYNSYIEANSFELANKSFTMEFWSKKLPAGYDDMVIGHGQWGKQHKSIHFGFRDNKLYCGFYGDDISSDTTYKDTAWHHYAMSFDDSTRLQSLYRDGELIKTRTADTAYLGTGKLYIGVVSAISRYYRGYLDEVRIWEVVRTAEEIQSGMNYPVDENEPGLLAYWRFDELRGNYVYDESNNENTAKLVNFPVEHQRSSLWTIHNIEADSSLVLFAGYSPISANTSISELTPPMNGTIGIDENNSSISYTPSPDWPGFDSLSWIVDDGINTDSCWIFINPSNFPVLSITDEPKSYDNNLNISIYPNPAKDYIYIDNFENKKLSLLIYDSTGKKISGKTINNTTTINCRHFLSGTYHFIVSDGKTSVENTVIISH